MIDSATGELGWLPDSAQIGEQDVIVRVQDGRGDSALQGNVDTIIDVARDDGGRGTIKAGSKFRIGNPAKVNFGYRLKAFEIGKCAAAITLKKRQHCIAQHGSHLIAP